MDIHQRPSVLLALATVFVTVFLEATSGFDSSNVTVTAVQNTDVELPCYVKHSEDNKIFWVDHQKTLLTVDDYVVVTDDKKYAVKRGNAEEWNLVIRNVQPEDQGEYMCQVRVNDTSLLIKRVRLNVKVPANIPNDDMEDYRFKEGDTLTFACDVQGQPSPTVVWYFSPEGQMTREEVGTGQQLTIASVERQASGTYECQASNGVGGVASKVFQVTIMFPPEVAMPTQRQGQMLGRDTILECSVTAMPNAVTAWSRPKDGSYILPSTSGSKYRIEAYRSSPATVVVSLAISGLQADDFGNYSCFASNQYGSVQRSMVLYEYGKSTEPEALTSTMEGTSSTTTTTTTTTTARMDRTTQTATPGPSKSPNRVSETDKDGSGSFSPRHSPMWLPVVFGVATAATLASRHLLH